MGGRWRSVISWKPVWLEPSGGGDKGRGRREQEAGFKAGEWDPFTEEQEEALWAGQDRPTSGG